jgi:TPR repeat protein
MADSVAAQETSGVQRILRTVSGIADNFRMQFHRQNQESFNGLKHYRPFCYARNRVQTLVMIHLKRGACGLPWRARRAALFGIATSLAISSTSAVANDIQATRACDLAAASPTDPKRPAGIAGVGFNDMDGKTALPACQAALAADPQNPRLMLEQARVFYVMKAYSDAHALFVKAADQGYADAQLWVGQYYESGRVGFPKDEREAARYYSLAADQGDAWAQAMLGGYYLNGRGGLTMNTTEAARLLKLSADQGNPSAQETLGFMYASGNGVSRNDREAVRLFKLAANQGAARAQFHLGDMYQTGRGVPKDDPEAARLFKLAADQGDTDAQTDLGLLYASGRGVEQDDREAVRLFKLAADQGDADAQNNLGFMYATGRGVEQDNGLAVYWLNKAVEQGNAQAKATLAQLAERARQPPKTPKVPSAVSYACFLDSFTKSGAVYHGKDSDKESADKLDRLNKECINNYLTTGRVPQ